MQKPLLLDYLHTLAKRTFKGHALYIELSAPDFPAKETVKECLSTIDTAQVFDTPDGDTILFFNNNKAHHLMLLSLKLKGLIGSTAMARYTTSYTLKSSFSTLYTRLYKRLCTPDTNVLHSLDVMQKIPHKPFTYEELTAALMHLEVASITHLIRKQPVYQTNGANMTRLTTSWFVKNTDVRRTLMPAVDMSDNLFFTTAVQDELENKVFQKIIPQQDWIGGINTSVAFLKSMSFQEWTKTHTATQKSQIFLDIDIADILRHWIEFDALHQNLSLQGYRFIARLSQKPAALNLLSLPVDYVKIPAPLLNDLIIPETVKPDVIVTHVSSPDSLFPLTRQGFTLFQGFVDPSAE